MNSEPHRGPRRLTAYRARARKLAPLRAFTWDNHLLACSFCNSNLKRDQYPVDAAGDCLLVDPTADDPADHLNLLLRCREYDSYSKKGEHTIRVFGLNRPNLVRGRRDAFCLACSNLRDWHNLRQAGDAEANRLAQALFDSPFVDVVHSWSARTRFPLLSTGRACTGADRRR
ncbi:hypothetical protein [Streptomyces mirabilis]|uniref:hypothetical protein n=1 Tax=Streptomyces mirabilis TaxID=68239 RepID=UPI0036A35B45